MPPAKNKPTKKAPAKKAPRRGVSAGTQAIRGFYGGYNIANGVTTRITDKNAAAFMESQLNDPTSVAYRPTSASGFGSTPLANKRGQRLGLFNNATGEFTLEGGGKSRGKGRGRAKGRPEEKGFAAGGETAAADQAYEPYAEADTTTTGMSRAQGKAYAASRAGMGGAREGQTYAREKGPAEESKAGPQAKRKGKGPKKAKPKRSPASRRRASRAKKK